MIQLKVVLVKINREPSRMFTIFFQFMDPTEAKEFGLIDKILDQIPKAGANEEESSGSQE